MSNKNTVIATANYFRQAFEGFAKAEYKHTDSTNKATFDTNANKRIVNYSRIANLLACLPKHIKLETERTSNGKYNIGTLVECIIKATADNCKRDIYLKATHGTDVVIDGVPYEIKAGLSCYSKPTPCTTDYRGKYQATILVNAKGIWDIPADEVVIHLDKNGCLPYNKACGLHFTELEQVLGYRD